MIRPSDNPSLFIVVDRIEKKLLLDAGISMAVIVLATASGKYLEGRRVGRIVVSQRLPFFPVRFTEIYSELYDIATLYGGLPIELVDIAVFTKEMHE